jgi:hypothetical protein
MVLPLGQRPKTQSIRYPAAETAGYNKLIINVRVYDACPASGDEHDVLPGACVREHDEYPNRAAETRTYISGCE